MRRREFIAALGGVAAWPVVAQAQAQPVMPVIGFLSSVSPGTWASRVAAYQKGLGETGFDVGRKVVIEYRWAENQIERLPALAADLVRRQVAVIVANNTTAPVAKAATTTIPIVFLVGGDPVTLGLVASLNRPGGNLTGVTTLGVELGPKQLELLHELVPKANIIAALINPANRNAETQTRNMQTAARALGIELLVLHASNERDLDTAFATLVQKRAGGIVISADALFTSRSEQLAELTARYAVPATYQFREFAAAGGLVSYGTSIADSYRLTGVYTGRVLKGEKPADLPVQRSTKVELFINLKTAKALGITVPLPLLGRADEVIE